MKVEVLHKLRPFFQRYWFVVFLYTIVYFLKIFPTKISLRMIPVYSVWFIEVSLYFLMEWFYSCHIDDLAWSFCNLKLGRMFLMTSIDGKNKHKLLADDARQHCYHI